MIDPKLYYMNSFSGSVALGQEWLEDFENRDVEFTPNWETWGGPNLVEVEQVNGEWVEVK